MKLIKKRKCFDGFVVFFSRVETKRERTAMGANFVSSDLGDSEGGGRTFAGVPFFFQRRDAIGRHFPFGRRRPIARDGFVPSFTEFPWFFFIQNSSTCNEPLLLAKPKVISLIEFCGTLVASLYFLAPFFRFFYLIFFKETIESEHQIALFFVLQLQTKKTR